MWATLPVLAVSLPLPLTGQADRPELDGPVETIDAGSFRVHFTREGADAPSLVDEDANGRPDLIDAVLAGLHQGEREFAEEEWRALAPDDGRGGSDAIDVYLRALDINGYAQPVPIGDGSYSCFLQVDNSTFTAGSVAESVALHELHHCVEYRYSVNVATWLYEAAATYEQYTHVLDPVLDVGASVLYFTRLTAPQLRLATTDGRSEYGAFLWMKFWAEFGGYDPGRLPALWADLAATTDWEEALDASSRDTFDLPLSELFLAHSTWNAFACTRDDQQHYEPDIIPCGADVGVPVTPWDGEDVSIMHDEGPYTAAYLEAPVASTGVVTLVCDGARGIRSELVQLRDQARIGSMTGGPNQGDPAVWMFAGDTALATVVGTKDDLDANCHLMVEPGEGVERSSGGCAVVGGTGLAWWDAWLWLLARRRRT